MCSLQGDGSWKMWGRSKRIRMGIKLRISLELLVVLAQVQFPLLSYKQKESSAADSTDQAGSLMERNAKSSREKQRCPHFLKQKGYYQHSYLGCIKRGTSLFERLIFFQMDGIYG